MLPTPSDEQQEAIDAIKAGKCLTIPAVAGSGKTTTMLQIASHLPPHRRVTIVTYNRSLRDECGERIYKCGLSNRVNCYTIHGLVSKIAKRICNDDHKLNEVVKMWDAEDANFTMVSNHTGMHQLHGSNKNMLKLDLLVLDEAQDLRPSFYKALCHIIKMSLRSCSPTSHHRDKDSDKSNHANNIQMCLVGDHKQMLYDFKTYGNDKASSQYLQNPLLYWAEFTHPREWVTTNLSTSYRLTPNVASFVNVIWGTSIRGGNSRVPNLPVEYLCRYPYPPSDHGENGYKLNTSVLSQLIDTHGAENVMFLAQSVRNEKCPIRVHVNELMKIRDNQRKQKYNFHIKESTRGFEGGGGAEALRNKVRVWTFCGSKGCEADCVVVFGLDMMNEHRFPALNQIGVALSRARKRLVVIHQMGFQNDEESGGRMLCPYTYYPMLGDDPTGSKHRVSCGGEQGSELEFVVPPCPEVGCTSRTEDGFLMRGRSLVIRSELTEQAMNFLRKNEVICLKQNMGYLPRNGKQRPIQSTVTLYSATDFNYFAASEEDRCLSYGSWIKEFGVRDRIPYNTDVQFKNTQEAVSALYGEAVVYMLQWKRQHFCPNVDSIVYNGILHFDKFKKYCEEDVRKAMKLIGCEPLSNAHSSLLHEGFGAGKRLALRGDHLVRFLNSAIKIVKKRMVRDKIIQFPVRAVSSGMNDNIMNSFLAKIKYTYEKASKSAAEWIYIANGVMAFGEYHDKWNQIGTDPKTYDTWVNSDALTKGMSRLSDLMQNIPSIEFVSGQKEDLNLAAVGGEFECELLHMFPDDKRIKSISGDTLLGGVSGICDWVGQGLVSEKGNEVDLLEIKFVNELSNENRLQVLIYCALLSLELKRSCSGMLFSKLVHCDNLFYIVLVSSSKWISNKTLSSDARTGEVEICSIDLSTAPSFLYDISEFKLNGICKTPKDDGYDAIKGEDKSVPRNCNKRKSVVSSQSRPSDHDTFYGFTAKSEVKVERKKPRSLDISQGILLSMPSSSIVIDLTGDSSGDEVIELC